MKYRSVLPMALLLLCTFALLIACGNALSTVFLQLRGPALFPGL